MALVELDDRVEAHIDGLRIAGDEGWALCKEELSWDAPGEVFTAGVLAFETGDEQRIEAVLEAAEQAENPRPLARGLISALGWIEYDRVKPHIETLLQSESPFRRLVGISGSAVHRRDPGQPLIDALRQTDNPPLAVRALRAAGELRLKNLLVHFRPHLQADDEACRFWAAWSMGLLGDAGGAVPLLRQIAESTGAYAQRAAATAMRLMPPEAARQWYLGLARQDETRRIAVIGAGVVGDPACVPWLFEMMQIPQLAREAFSTITGVDLDYDDLDGDEPEGFEAGPTEDPQDEDVDMDADEDLPWPNPEAIAPWWEQRKGQFQAGNRYLLGKPVSITWLEQVLRTGSQRQRTAAAFELALARPQGPLFEVRAPGKRQQHVLGQQD